MGCVRSSLTKPFQVKCDLIGNVLQDAQEGKRIHVAGTARTADVYMESPFGPRQCFLAALTAHAQNSQWGGKGTHLFSMKAALPFRVLGNSGESLYVDVSPDSPVTFTSGMLQEKYVNYDIARTGQDGAIRSTPKPGIKAELRERPDALAWWSKHAGRRDPIGAMQGAGRMGTARVRMVTEYLLQPGDAVAVGGTLVRGSAGWKIVRATVTTSTGYAKSLEDVKSKRADPGTRKVMMTEKECLGGVAK